MSNQLGYVRRPAIDRFADKVALTDDGCLEWLGADNGTGYGYFWSGDGQGRLVLAHRWIYERHVGPIPQGLEVDHLCRNRSCVNPEHLEPVTPRENNLRSPISNANKTRCPSGHPYDDANTYVRPLSGQRYCRACMQARRQLQAREAS